MKILSYPTKVAPGASITIGFKCHGNPYVLEKLKAGKPCTCPELAKYSRMTATLYTVYQTASDVLMGNHLEISRNKIMSMGCGYQNGEFYIHVSVSAAFGAIRRVILRTIKSMNVLKNYQKYVSNIKLLNGKAVKEDFLHCANKVQSCIPKLTVVVTGKGFKKEQIDSIGDRIDLKPFNFKETKMPFTMNPDMMMSCAVNNTTLNTSGLQAVFVKRYIETFTSLKVEIIDGKVVVCHNVNLSKIYSDARAQRFASKYDKIKDLKEFMLFSASNDGLLSASDLIEASKKKYTVAQIISDIKHAIA